MKKPESTVTDSPILFGGVPGIPGPEVFATARKNNPPAYQLLEAAYEQFASVPEHAGIYADPKGKGATVEQVWLVFTLFGVEPYCLLARPVPSQQLTRVTKLERLTGGEIVDVLKKIQLGEGQINASTLHYDGKTGHCIRIESYDQGRDRFVYHDPWPLKSLLCQENNMAGVDAQPEGKLWSVTAAEMQRVLFASFVLPHAWARLQGVKFDLMFDDWLRSEFFKFFHLKQTAERSENAMNRRMFTAGPFKDDVTLTVDYKESGKIVKAVLMLELPWMAKNPLLALDIAKSFIPSFAPSPDAEKYAAISRALWSLRDPNEAQAIRAASSSLPQQLEFIDAFVGTGEKASLITDFGGLTVKNVAYEQQRLLELEFALN